VKKETVSYETGEVQWGVRSIDKVQRTGEGALKYGTGKCRTGNAGPMMSSLRDQKCGTERRGTENAGPRKCWTWNTK